MTTALSILQPWAWCIVNGHKSIENRTWSSKHRGRLLIHAGKGVDREAYAFIRKILPGIDIPGPGEIERGGVVGEARMVGCVTAHASPWFFGDYGFLLEDAVPLPFVPWRGQLGFFEINLADAVPMAGAASDGQGSLL